MKLWWERRLLGVAGVALVAVWLGWLVARLFFPDGPTAGLTDEWFWLVLGVGFACLAARASDGGRVVSRLRSRGRSATGTIVESTYRGTWGEGEGATHFDWFDLWLRVVPEDREVAPFMAFTTHAFPRGQRERWAAGLMAPVVYDPATGVTVLIVDGHMGEFSVGRTLRKLGRVRRVNRRRDR